MTKKTLFGLLYAIVGVGYITAILRNYRTDDFMEAYLPNFIVLIAMYLIVPILEPTSYQSNNILRNIFQFVKNRVFLFGYFGLTSAYLGATLWNFEWYEILPKHLAFSLLTIFILECLRQFITKRYNSQYYIITCCFIMLIILLARLICF
ncbi:hypothetical protein [Capnocytophaga genosp. AHN8471]|jgi:hypothetical protein|uniref:hypothetical protein n=1 Tax=Capnocytophaga genosp. AHN8471 TaxID=327574 RepID=UPI001931D406|nr:hypothetical protein [Capnocytophaga genosp. AHN8471]MBM0660118.1 hypothetical protein [Capnocytophaga genosp. AHN8471]